MTNKKILPTKEYIEISGSIIPASDKRWCGPEFKDDNFYLRSAGAEANRLIKHLQCTTKSRVLDIGCGQGRLPIGILRVLGKIDYTGIDVHKESIDWCRRYIAKDNPSFKFRHLNVYNERYNVNGIKLDDNFYFDLEKESVDIIYLFSVFSHTIEKDMRIYLRDCARILDKNGRMFLTAFAEDNVPDISINPEDFRVKCSGPLHVVRYDREYLFSIIEEYDLSILDFTHGTETSGQSAIYLGRKKG